MYAQQKARRAFALWLCQEYRCVWTSSAFSVALRIVGSLLSGTGMPVS